MESNAMHNGTGFPNSTSHSLEDDGNDRRWIILSIFNLFVSISGMVGNGIVIWILGCHTKRNPFSTLILNLSIADCSLLTALVPYIIGFILYMLGCKHYSDILYLFLNNLILFTFSASQFLLAAISIDRCVCLFFPIWHKCHRPRYLSTIMCVTVWILTFLISAVNFALSFNINCYILWYHQFLLDAVLCMPAMAVSTIAMLIKIHFLSTHHKRGKALTAILLALLFFLFFAFPMNVSQLLLYYNIPASPLFYFYVQIGAPFNSAINPFIYFLVGRDKKSQSRGRIREILKKLFQEEKESSRNELESSIEIPL